MEESGLRDVGRLAVPATGAVVEAPGDRVLPVRLTGADGAGRAEARDFMLWLEAARKPERQRAPGSPPPGSVNPVTRKPYPGVQYAVRTRRHNRAVVRAFYEYHREAGTGPMVNPMPAGRGRDGGRADAHHNPLEKFERGRRADFQPQLPRQEPRYLPDAAFDALFAALGSDRDRAIVAFYISTGARASELLGVTCGRVDVGQQLVGVFRKGSGALQWLPASADAFNWLRLYRRGLGDRVTWGAADPLWVTLRRPHRPLAYPADGRRPGAVTAGRAMAAGPCADHHHSDLHRAVRGRGDRTVARPSRRTSRASAAGRAGPGLPPRGARHPAGDVTVTAVAEQPVAAGTRLLEIAGQSGGSLPLHRMSLRRLLDWLESHPGSTWQQRWQASGAEQAGKDWAVPLAGSGRRGGGTADQDVIYPEDVITGHRAFIARRRTLRPGEEYRDLSPAEWDEFLGHFELRKVELGVCTRDFGTPCVHEHACIRCPALRPDPAQRQRLEDILASLRARLAEAREQGWGGEIAGLEVSIAAAGQKLAAMGQMAARNQVTHLGMPDFRPAVGRSLGAAGGP
jgi:integrase